MRSQRLFAALTGALLACALPWAGPQVAQAGRVFRPEMAAAAPAIITAAPAREVMAKRYCTFRADSSM